MRFFFVKVVTRCISLAEKSSSSFWCLSGFVDFCWGDFVCELTFHLFCNNQVLFLDSETRTSSVVCTCSRANQLNLMLNDFPGNWLASICLNYWLFWLFLSRKRIICTEDKSLTLVSRFVISAEYETLAGFFLCFFFRGKDVLLRSRWLGIFVWYWNYLCVLKSAFFIRWLRCRHCNWSCIWKFWTSNRSWGNYVHCGCDRSTRPVTSPTLFYNSRLCLSLHLAFNFV